MTEPNEIETKRGARHNKPDQERVQAIHDHALALGATPAGAKKANYRPTDFDATDAKAITNAPNLRDASMQMCAGCAFYQLVAGTDSGVCTKFEFMPAPYWVCDAYEMQPAPTVVEQVTEAVTEIIGEAVAMVAGDMSEYSSAKTETMSADSLIAYGGAIKALGDGRIGGYLVSFGSPSKRDLTGVDWFSPRTDYGDAVKSDVYFHHGLPVEFKQRGGKKELVAMRFVISKADLKKDDVGVWAETILDMRNEYERMLYDKATKSKLGWSSGTLPHLVVRDPETGEILKWALGLDASLTPQPAESDSKNTLQPIKALPQLTFDFELPEADAEGANVVHVADAAELNEAKTDHVNGQDSARALAGTSEAKEMGFTPEEKATLLAEFQAQTAETQANAIKSAVDAMEAKMRAAPAIKTGGYLDGQAPAHLKAFSHGVNGNGEFVKAYSHEALAQYVSDPATKGLVEYLRTGDKSAIKASNAVAMQEDTNAEGGYTVPVGLYQGIIARRNEGSLRAKLGLRNIPGKGKTVDVPIDNEADGEFVSTAEEAAMDADSPDISQAVMTLVKYTKKITLSWELLYDEDVNLLAFLADWIGRGMAKTENSLILTEAATTGTALKTFAAAAAFSVGEMEAMIYNSNVSYYLDDSGSNAWVMRPGTYAALSSLTGNPRQYAETPQGSNGSIVRPTLLGYPVFFSEKAAALAASAKDVYFGNWYYMGYREAPGLTFLRDEFSRADNGQVVLRYYFRQVYKQLQAAAIGYGVHPSA